MNDPNFEANLAKRASETARAGDRQRSMGAGRHDSVGPVTGRPSDPRTPGQGWPSRGDGSGDDWQASDAGGPPEGRDRRSDGDQDGSAVPALRSRQQPARSHDYPVEGYGGLPLAYGEPLVDDARIDLRKYLWLLFKHRWLIAGSAGVFVVLGLLATLLSTPIYRASTTIQINRDAAKVVDFEGGGTADAGREVEFYQTQYELLKSRSLAERAAADLNLQDDPAYLNADMPSPLTRLKRLLFGGPAAKTGDSVAARQKAAGGAVLDGLSVEPVRASSIVRLSFDNPDPRLAQKVVNGVAAAYIAVNLERRYESSAYARTFLEERLQQLKVKLEQSEKELVAYAERQQIVSTGKEQTLAMTNLAAANDALAAATTERVKKELLWQQVQETEGLGLPKILESEAIETMRAKRVELAAEYQDRLSFFKPAFPEMRKLKAQIDEMDRQIAAEVALIKQSVKAEYDAAANEERSLAERVEGLKAEVTDFRNRNIQYNILQREVDTNRQLYDGLLQRYKEIGVAGGVGTNNVSIVDRAQVPAVPYKPRLSRNLAIALMLGLMFGGAAAFAREHLDDTFKSPEDVEENLGLPLLGIIPRVRESENPADAVMEPRSAISEAYRSLRTALQFSTSSGVPKSLLVTSSRAGEGKSTTALTLARNFAQLGMRVLLIDADLRKPALHRYLNIDDSVGLTNCLVGTLVPTEALRRTDLPGLTVMPCGPLPPNPAELLAGPRMLSLLTIASQKYDLVIIDGPPVAGLADAPLLASLAAGTLLVIDASATRRTAAKAALKRLHFARAQVVGAVINKLDLSAGGYAYGYGYGDAGYYGEDAPARLTDKRRERG